MQANPPELVNIYGTTIPNETEGIVDQQTVAATTNRTMIPTVAGNRQVQAGNSSDVITVRALDSNAYNSPIKPGYPPVIWVIGGPGSNKAVICSRAVTQRPGWIHISIGRVLRAAAEPSPTKTDSQVIRQAISSGEMVPQEIVLRILETQINANMSASGLMIDGYPRDLKQANEFEVKVFKIHQRFT